MTVFLLVLKIIGIVLLCLLGIILLILISVLTVPVRYRLKASKEETDTALKACFAISWLLHVIHISLLYCDNGIDLTFRILGIPLKRKNFLGEKDTNKATNTKAEKKDSEPGIKELGNEDSGYFKIETSNDDISDKPFENEVINESSDNDIQNKPLTATENVHLYNKEINKTVESVKNTENKTDSDFIRDNESDQEENTKKKSFFNKIVSDITGFCNLLKNILLKLIETVKGLITKTDATIDNISKEYSFFNRYFNDERNKVALKKCKKNIFKLLNHMKPKRVKGDVSFGFEDPYVTGQILSVLGIIYPVLPKKLYINPEFDNEILEGHLMIRGRIRVCNIIFYAASVYFDKNFKRLIRIYKKHSDKKTSN